MLKRISILFMILTILNQVVFASGTFSDLAENELEAAVEVLYGEGIINGVEEGIFSPDLNVTRADFCCMITRAMKYDTSLYTSEFTDVSSDAYYYKDVSCLSSKKIVNGYGDEFKPENNITVSEAAKILVCVYESKYGEITYDSSTVIGGTDRYAQIEAWAKRYIIRGFMLGFIPRVKITNITQMGDGSDSFEPNKAVTRIEAAEITYNLINVLENMQGAFER